MSAGPIRGPHIEPEEEEEPEPSVPLVLRLAAMTPDAVLPPAGVALLTPAVRTAQSRRCHFGLLECNAPTPVGTPPPLPTNHPCVLTTPWSGSAEARSAGNGVGTVNCIQQDVSLGFGIEVFFACGVAPRSGSEDPEQVRPTERGGGRAEQGEAEGGVPQQVHALEGRYGTAHGDAPARPQSLARRPRRRFDTRSGSNAKTLPRPQPQT